MPCAQEHQPILLQWPLTHSTNICCDEVLRSVHLDLPHYYLSIYKIGVMMMSYLMYSTLHSHRHKKRELCLLALLTTVHSNVLNLLVLQSSHQQQKASLRFTQIVVWFLFFLHHSAFWLSHDVSGSYWPHLLPILAPSFAWAKPAQSVDETHCTNKCNGLLLSQ